jgi:hypothetical protein
MPDIDMDGTYRYRADTGLAATLVDRQLPAEMAELDLHPGTEVTVHGYDDDRDLVLVEWSDRSGNPRITSVEPATFAANFEKVGE